MRKINKDNLNYDDVVFEIIKKPFLQIELIQKDIEGASICISIHKFLDKFYIKNNKLLDKIFLKWYINTYYNIELREKYELHIIDSDINMFTINNNDYIKIKDNDNNLYNIISTKHN